MTPTTCAIVLVAAAALVGACGTPTPEAPPAPAPTVVESTPAPARRAVAAAPTSPSTDVLVDIPGRRYKADPRALELVRRADAVMYRPTDHGLHSLRCKVEYRVDVGSTDRTVYRAKYEMTSPGVSTLVLESTESSAGHAARPWGDDSPSGLSRFAPATRCKNDLDDLFDGPRLERRLEPYELMLHEEGGKPFVLARCGPEEHVDDRTLDFHFGADGTVSQDGPGDPTVHPFCSLRRRPAYDKLGELFVRRGGMFFDDGNGFELFKYETISGVRLPTKHASTIDGMMEILTISDIELNPTR